MNNLYTLIQPKIFVNFHYLDGVLVGSCGCRWALVFGYDDYSATMGNAVCIPMVNKPTKKIIRQYKKEARKWVVEMKKEREYEDIVIDIMGFQ